MKSRSMWLVVSLMIVVALLAAACQPAAQQTVSGPITFGMLLVGPYNDHGWSEATYNGALYAQQQIADSEFVYLDNVNTSSRPGTTPEQLAEDLLSRGAQVVIFNSDDMIDGAHTFAVAHPEITVLHLSGDGAWVEGENFQDLPNLVNVMGQMEYGKMIAGCAAALTTQTGQIGYLGPLINSETRRLAASAYLGARYCWTEYLGNDPADLQFRVNWIGFWFNIPGFTQDPTQVADEFYNTGYDVVISGIDTTEALVEADRLTQAGTPVYALAYDYVDACAQAPTVCLGVPYFNWGPAITTVLEDVQAGTIESSWSWLGPDWADINNPDTSYVGFVKGDALSDSASVQIDQFIAELAGGLNLWTGPLNLQDGTVYLADGETATQQQIWYLPQLLEGMEGASVPTE